MDYSAPVWLKGGHAQTIWPLLIKGSLPLFERQRWNTPDGDFIDLDFLPYQHNQPLLILFHGLEGSSSSHYARSLMRAATEQGWNGVVVHFRGCSGQPNRLARAYHSGDGDEIDWILRRFAETFPGIVRFAAGVSLGGNALLYWLGTRGADARHIISRAAAISAPLDLVASGEHLAKGFNTVYTRNFLATMRKHALYKAEKFPGAFDINRALQARTLAEFDDAYTAPVHGFRNVRDYWVRASAKPWLPFIEVPTLLLNARNDPFLPSHVLPTAHEVSSSVVLDQPDEGGHVGFVGAGFPGHLNWMPKQILSYLASP